MNALKKIRISAVSYLNTLPFAYGMEQHSDFLNQIELSRDIPSECARKLITGEVDLGLVPVAVIPKIKKAQIISDYCIGAEGAVHSVLLVSEKPIEEIEEVYLDFHSRTSVQLCQLLLKHFWKKEVKFLTAEEGYIENIKGSTAGVIIGDRTFDLSPRFKHRYDLAEAWQAWQNLPFVFAAWVSNKKLNQEFIQQFNQVLAYGLSHKREAIQHLSLPFPSVEEQITYLEKHIQYEFDEKMKKALNTFLDFIA
ncbi:MAG: menaquinone biosynthesis protein [Vicingaceae bacterium]